MAFYLFFSIICCNLTHDRWRIQTMTMTVLRSPILTTDTDTLDKLIFLLISFILRLRQAYFYDLMILAFIIYECFSFYFFYTHYLQPSPIYKMYFYCKMTNEVEKNLNRTALVACSHYIAKFP